MSDAERIFELAMLLERYALFKPSPTALREADALKWVLDRLRREFPAEHREAMRAVMRRKDERRPHEYKDS